MEPISRDVAKLDPSERTLNEAVVGHPLLDNQRVMIQVVEVATEKGTPDTDTPSADGQLPEWCRVFADVPVNEMQNLEAMILDLDQHIDGIQ